MIKTVIFDFDGVLADSFDTFYPLLRDSVAHVGLKLSPHQYRDFFIGNVHQSLKNFVNDDDKYSHMMEFRKNNYDKYYYDPDNKAKLFPGAATFLEKLKKLNNDMVLTIASSGRRDNIEDLLGKNNIRGLFDTILANTANTKEGMIQEILNESNAKKEEAVMISDTVGDIEVAKRVGLQTVAVTWGFQSRDTLEKAGPNFLADNFNELFAKLTNG